MTLADWRDILQIILSLLALPGIAMTLWNVRKIEKATNSMKDALVATTARANYSAGTLDERDRGDAKAADLAASKPPPAVTALYVLLLGASVAYCVLLLLSPFSPAWAG